MPIVAPEGHGGTTEGRDDISRLADGIATAVRGILREAKTLDPTPSSSAKTDRAATLARERTPARIDILVHLDNRIGVGWSEQPDDTKAAGTTLPIRPTLRRWEQLIRVGRQMPRRGAHRADLYRFLLAHADWCARQPWAGEMRDQLRTLHMQLQHANGTAPDPPVGRCYLPQDPGTCGGRIWIDDEAGAARCGRCHATWDGPQLAMLKHELEQARLEHGRPKTADGRPMMTAREIVDAGLATSKANVYLRAHRAKTAAVNGHYDPGVFQ